MSQEKISTTPIATEISVQENSQSNEEKYSKVNNEHSNQEKNSQSVEEHQDNKLTEDLRKSQTQEIKYQQIDKKSLVDNEQQRNDSQVEKPSLNYHEQKESSTTDKMPVSDDPNERKHSQSVDKKSLIDDKERRKSQADKESLGDDQEQRKYSQVENKFLVEDTDKIKSSEIPKKSLVNDKDERKFSHAKEALTHGKKYSMSEDDDSKQGEKFSKGANKFDEEIKSLEKSPAEEKKQCTNVTDDSIAEIPCEKKTVPKLGEEKSVDDKQHSKPQENRYSKMTDESTQPKNIDDSQTQEPKHFKRASVSLRRERTYSIPVGASSGEIRYSKAVQDRKRSKPVVERVISSEYVMQNIEVLEALPIPDKKMSKVGYENSKPDTRYFSIIEELEAQKEKTIMEKSLDQRTSTSGKKLRFGEEEEVQKRETDILPVPKGMRFEYRACPKTCEKFLNIEEFASLFVNDIIHEALVKGKIIRRESSTKIVEGIEYKDEEDPDFSSITSIGTYVCVFEWPTIEEFTIPLGASKISEYFSYWKFDEDWKYCINYLRGESDAACDFYRYEAIFSIPCRQYPIPQATASVYFTFEVSRVRPKHCLVDAYYSLEGHRLVHTPGQFKLQEAWLFHIIDAKINFYKTLKF